MAVQRNIDVNITGNLPINGYKAVLQRVQEFERLRAEGRPIRTIDSTLATPDPAMRLVLTSLSQYEVYVMDLTDHNPATGLYNLTLVSIGL